ncbi:type II toxin-antitoxin system VapC family toxin [Longimicrobium sp.]|uniref:type II toxin-antitoxin system VapC family toxin n=1 Tax=Longimicrobium sp. TaxID=2029185 RepID=UPI003B3A42A5
MDKPTLYIETSVVSYLAADRSGHPVTAANQRLTHEWWNTRRHDYALFTSETVLQEAADGDPNMAARRMTLLAGSELLLPLPGVSVLASEIQARIKLPPRAITDTLHVAFAAVYNVGYLLTWNCKHIANPALKPQLLQACRLRGFELPVLCTPKDLLRG